MFTLRSISSPFDCNDFNGLVITLDVHLCRTYIDFEYDSLNRSAGLVISLENRNRIVYLLIKAIDTYLLMKYIFSQRAQIIKTYLSYKTNNELNVSLQ